MSQAPDSPARVMESLRDSWDRSDWLFDLVPRERWVTRGIELRHPFLFYIGHLPAFGFNHIAAALGDSGLDPELDVLFARGIDPADEGEAEGLRPTEWPSVRTAEDYRDRARAAIAERVPQLAVAAADHPVARDVMSLVLEHELMHHETLLYMIRQLDPDVLRVPGDHRPPELGVAHMSPGRVDIAAGPVRLGVDLAEIPFAWDNEVPAEQLQVPAFAMDRVPVTVRQFLEFVRSGGYDDESLWTPKNLEWLRGEGRGAPLGWRKAGAGWQVRSLFAWHDLHDVGGWPVQVSHAEALAYAAWSGARLPTEAELHRAAFTAPDGSERPFPWGDAAPGPQHGVFDFGVHGRAPVGSRPEGASAWGVHDLVGNGWEWTSTPFLPRPGFAPIHPNYPGYSSDFFDGEHFVVFGGSWATDAALLRRSFRNWYQGRYPYVFSAFRTVARSSRRVGFSSR